MPDVCVLRVEDIRRRERDADERAAKTSRWERATKHILARLQTHPRLRLEMPFASFIAL